jgi:cobalamin biosynthesis protein CobD/CbiB
VRGCLILLLLLILVAANGYTVFQMHAMRAALDEIREEMGLAGDSERRSMLECARDAAEAIGEGQLDRAAEELRRLDEMLRETRQMAESQRKRAAEQLEAARRAVAEGSQKAREEVEKLVRMLSLEEKDASDDRE